MKKLCVVTPWRPHVGGVALHSYEMITQWLKVAPELDITVVTSCKDPKPLPGVTIISAQTKSQLPNFSQYDKVVHVLTNHPYANLSLYLLPKIGGIVILHEYNFRMCFVHNLTHRKLFSWEVRDLRNPYPKLIGRYRLFREAIRDWEILRVLKRFSTLKIAVATRYLLRLSFSGPYLRKADHIICFSDKNKKHLSKHMKIPEKAVSVARLTLGFPQQVKQVYDRKEGFVFGLFGHQSPFKRYKQVIRAFYHLKEKHRGKNFPLKLHIVGSYDPEVVESICNYNLEDKVRLVSKPSDEQWSKELAEVDCIIALRNPTWGEGSGPIVQSASNGTLAIVNDIDWFGGLPSWAAIKLKNIEFEELVDVLVVAMEKAYCFGDSSLVEARRKKIQDKARDYFCVKKAAEQMLHLIQEANSGIELVK